MTLWVEKREILVPFSLDIAEGFGYCVVGNPEMDFRQNKSYSVWILSELSIARKGR